jgi:hypothetical protein
MRGGIAIGKASRIAALTVGLAVAAAANAAERPDAANAAARPGAVDTFVSGLGNDSNASANCPRTAPCRTLSGAYPVTQAGGDIIALDPADYGPLTITGPVSVLGMEGAVIAVASGKTGIAINAAAADKIVIKDLTISGAGAPNTTGIAITGGHLVLRDATLKLLATGLSVTNAHADVLNTDVIGNTTGIETNGVGVPYNTAIGVYLPTACSPSCPTLVRINGGNYTDNTTVFLENNPTSSGGQPTQTFWSGNYFATGYTTLETSTGTGGSAGHPASPSDVTPFPN